MRKLVFIDDDPIDHFMMKHILRGSKNHFDTTTYTIYGSLVLDYIEENKSEPDKLPDVIFLDLNMPQFNGWDFLERMQQIIPKLNKDIRVYVLSSSVRSIDQEASLKYSFVNEFISKPMVSAEVERIMANQYVE